MKHFDITAWTDFARGLGSASQRRVQAQHLATGCQKCTQMVETLRHVVRAAETILENPPAAAIERAESIFAIRASKRQSALTTLLATLSFDSFQMPAAAGVRSLESSSRHALFQAGTFDIDVRLEYDQHSPRVGLVGQIASHESPSSPVARVPVTVSAGNAIVARTIANDFGEFQLQYERGQQVTLRVPLARGTTIEVPLSSLESTTKKGRTGRRSSTTAETGVRRGTRARRK